MEDDKKIDEKEIEIIREKIKEKLICPICLNKQIYTTKKFMRCKTCGYRFPLKEKDG